MGSIQSLGVGSGLDVNSIISQLMAIEQQPIKRLEKAASGVQSEISTYGTIKSKLDALDSGVATLAKAQTWLETSVNLNGADEFSVTASTDASPVELDIHIQSLAQRQSIATTAFTSGDATVGTGTLSIQIGTWTAAGFSGFDPQLVDDPDNPGNSIPRNVEIVIDADHQSLSDIRDAINGAGAGVTASILNDASGARLVVRSDDTGEVNGFKIEVSDSTGELGALSFTAQSDPATASGARGNAQGANLQATLNGAAVSSASNTLTEVLDGITIRALRPTSSTKTAAIERDVEGMKTKVNAFVTAYNELNVYLKQQTAYNAASQTAGALQGDRVAISLQSRLRNEVTGSSAASSVFERLSTVGIELQKDGTLKVNDSKLTSALNNLPQLAKLFSQDDASAVNDGIAVRLTDLIDDLVGTDGGITTKQASLNERLSRNLADQERLAARLATVEARLKAQYSALDTKMASLNGLNQYIGQQIQQSNKSSG